MSIEIKELVIRTAIAANDDDDAGTSNAVDNDSIIEECVRQVLVIMERKNER